MTGTSDNSRIAKNTIFLYIRMIVVLLVSLYTTRVVLNVLGVVDYGIYNVVAGFVGMFTFLNNSMISTTQRYYNFEMGAGSIKSLNEVYNTSLLIQSLLVILVFISLESFGIWYINNKMIIPEEKLYEARWVFQFSAVSLSFVILSIPYSAAIVAHEKMNYFAIVSIVDAILKLLIAIIIPYIGSKRLIYYSALLLSITICNFLMYYIYSKRSFEEVSFKLMFKKDRFKSMLSFSGWNLFDSFAYTLQGQGLNVLINAFFGPVVNAARGIAFQIQGAINGFSSNIALAFRPQLVQSYAKNNYDQTQYFLFTMSKYCYFMLYILVVPIAVELKYILALWLKGAIPQYTIIFTYLVLIDMLLGSLNMPITQTVLATGKVRSYQIIRGILVGLTLPISWIFLKLNYSPAIVFCVTIVVSIINQPVSMILLHNNFKYSYRLYLKKVIFPCALLTVILPIVPVILHFTISEVSFWKMVTIFISSLLISVIIAYYVIVEDSDKSMVLSYINSLKEKVSKLIP